MSLNPKAVAALAAFTLFTSHLHVEGDEPEHIHDRERPEPSGAASSSIVTTVAD